MTSPHGAWLRDPSLFRPSGLQVDSHFSLRRRDQNRVSADSRGERSRRLLLTKDSQAANHRVQWKVAQRDNSELGNSAIWINLENKLVLDHS